MGWNNPTSDEKGMAYYFVNWPLSAPEDCFNTTVIYSPVVAELSLVLLGVPLGIGRFLLAPFLASFKLLGSQTRK